MPNIVFGWINSVTLIQNFKHFFFKFMRIDARF